MQYYIRVLKSYFLVSEEYAESQECHNQHHTTHSGSWPGTRTGIHIATYKRSFNNNFIHIHYEKTNASVIGPPFSLTEIGRNVLVVGESVGARDAVSNGYTEESEALHICCYTTLGFRISPREGIVGQIWSSAF